MCTTVCRLLYKSCTRGDDDEFTDSSNIIVVNSTPFDALPLDLAELLQLKTFTMLFLRHLRTRQSVSRASQAAYATLAGVCFVWWNTFYGRSRSSDRRRCLRQHLRRVIANRCPIYRCRAQLVHELTAERAVWGVAHLDGRIYVISDKSDVVQVFAATNYDRTCDIRATGLNFARDIVACADMRSLFVADWCGQATSPGCVWQLSLDGRLDPFLPTATGLRPMSLSLASRRLLVTTWDALLLYSADDAKLLLTLTVGDLSLTHAVETPRGTFFVSHLKPHPQVVEVNARGRMLNVYLDAARLVWPIYLAADPTTGGVFVADYRNHHVLLLSGDLRLGRVLTERRHSRLAEFPWLDVWPRRVVYVEERRQLIVGNGWLDLALQVFSVG